MDKDDIQLVLLALSTVGTFAIVYLNLPNQAISLPSIPPIAQQIGGGVTASILAALLLRFIFKISSSLGTPGLLEDAKRDVTLRELDAIEGCLKVSGALWRGTAHISNGELEEIEVPYKAYCRRCHTLMYDDEKEGVPVAVLGKTEYMDCPDCGFRTEKSISKYHDAEKLFDTHFEQIIESDSEEYSFQTLIENIDEGVTPRRVWEEYVEVVDDDKVSTDCFR